MNLDQIKFAANQGSTIFLGDSGYQVIVDSLNMDSKGVRGGTRRRKARGLRMRVSSRRSRTKRSR